MRSEISIKRKLSSTENVDNEVDDVTKRDSSGVDAEVSRAVEGRVQVHLLSCSALEMKFFEFEL